MNAEVHAKNSARKYGGKPSDYIGYHRFMDQCKIRLFDVRHRLITHNTWFIGLALRILNRKILNSDGVTVDARSVLEDHVREDMAGRLPTLEENFRSIKAEDVARETGVFDAILHTAQREEDRNG